MITTSDTDCDVMMIQNNEEANDSDGDIAMTSHESNKSTLEYENNVCNNLRIYKIQHVHNQHSVYIYK